MLLPWSHDTGPLTRRPWLTLLLIAVCVVTLVSSQFDPAVQQFERAAESAHEYWAAHPYLEPGELLADHFGDEGATARKEFRASLAAGEVPIPVHVVDAEQARLDELSTTAEAALERHVWRRYGLVPAAPRVRGLFGHLFLHGGWGHLLGNLLFLFLTAPFLEDRWGRSSFGLFYLASGVAAALLFCLQNPNATTPLIGASGAIAGAMGAFLVVFGAVRIKFAYWLGFFWGTFAAPAWLLLPLWFAHELATAQLLDVSGASDGIAYWAHVGGFAFGVLAAGLLRVTGADARLADSTGSTAGQSRAEPDPAPGGGVGDDPEPDGLEALWAAVASGDRSHALRLFRDARRESGAVPTGPPDLCLRLAGWLAARADGPSAALLLAALLPDADPELASRIAGAARRLDPALARRAQSLAAPDAPTARRSAAPSVPTARPPVDASPSEAPESPNPPTIAAPTPGPTPAALPPASQPPVEPGIPTDAEAFDVDALDLSEKEEAAWDLDELLDLDTPGRQDGGDDAELFDRDALDLGED
ncbi:MAG: hypothetical protein CL910_10315 [Deltaproteobacteria bacterium]|nr:hypothetical protein [Deltaproteobacteria bacterium]